MKAFGVKRTYADCQVVQAGNGKKIKVKLAPYKAPRETTEERRLRHEETHEAIKRACERMS